MLEISEREDGVVALHLPIGPLKTRYVLELVPRCELGTYQTISRRLNHCAIGAGMRMFRGKGMLYLTTPRAGFRHVEAPGQPSAVELWMPTLP